MKPHRRGELTNPWILITVSAIVVGGLALVLWSPWNRQGIAGDRTLVFYCAAGMAKPVTEIADAYKKKYGVEVQVNFGGTGKLLATLRANGGKGDLYLAADVFHMKKAEVENLVRETMPVAHLRPVLIINKSTQKKLKAKNEPVTKLNDLFREDLKVVLANPELAAVGKLVKDALSRPQVDLWSRLSKELKSASPRVSTVGTVNEVNQAVRTQEGVIGIVWEAVAKQNPHADIIRVPEFENDRELIQIGVLADAKDKQATAALQFARYLTARDKGLQTFAKHHFQPIADGDVWSERPAIRLSAGAMLKPGIDNDVKAFAEREGIDIDTSYNGCGLLVSQMRSIKAADPSGQKKFPDAYFSCDVSYLDMVQDWFDAAVVVSKNKMVIIVKKGNPHQISSLEDLVKKENLKLKIGLGHKKNSALGKLTDDLLKKIGLHEKYYGKDSRGRIVHQDAGHALVNQVRIDALDVAVVYRSNAKANPENVQKHMDIVPIDIADAFATQPFAVAKDSRHKYLMRRLLRAIVTQQSADRFRTLGFEWKYRGE